ncbi:MAG: hydrogenase formation protein HypD [Victivallaceae bacterium]
MKYVDEFRNSEFAAALTREITALASRLNKPVNIMEVCGSHTMAIARHGIREALPASISLISGPGCPVCVTEAGYIDAAIELGRKGAVIATFGDMLNVPGSTSSLAKFRAEGGRVEICYSPDTAAELAERAPNTEVVFLAVGFETTIGPAVSVIDSAINKNLKNLSILPAFKQILPALEALSSDPEIRIDAFLCPAHVSAIIGADAYKPFAEKHKIPCVISGFEPVDILHGIAVILKQILAGTATVENQYSRVVRPEGNALARSFINTYLETADAWWRGIGVIPQSGFAVREEFADYDASVRFNVPVQRGSPDKRCQCGNVLKGKIRPDQCGMFAKVCNPENPVGPCMVSSEGTCSAYFKYGRVIG